MDEPVEGFAVPVHRALTEPILLGGAPRAVAIVNGTARRGARPRPAAVDRGPPALGDRPCRRRLGREARSAVCRGRKTASAHPHPSERVSNQ